MSNSIKEMLKIYRNYLFALQEREEHGDKYGDTDELIKMYEEQLGINKPKLNEALVKALKKGK